MKLTLITSSVKHDRAVDRKWDLIAGQIFLKESSGEGKIPSTHGEQFWLVVSTCVDIFSFVLYSIRERGQCEWSSYRSHNFDLMHTL